MRQESPSESEDRLETPRSGRILAHNGTFVCGLPKPCGEPIKKPLFLSCCRDFLILFENLTGSLGLCVF